MPTAIFSGRYVSLSAASTSSEGRGSSGFGVKRACSKKRSRFSFPEASQGDSLQTIVTGIDEDEDIAASRVRSWWSDVLGERIVMELLVHHDPHTDAVPAHHGQEHLVTLDEPSLAHRHLLGPAEKSRLRL